MLSRIIKLIFLLSILLHSTLNLSSQNQEIDLSENSFGRIGWLNSLYIGMPEREFLRFWEDRLMMNLRSVARETTGANLYNDRLDILDGFGSVNFFLPEKIVTMEGIEERFWEDHLPTLTQKEFDYYEVKYEDAPDLMKLFRNRVIPPNFLDDVISEATFWFHRDLNEKTLFRVDISLRDNSDENVSKIIELMTNTEPVRNTVRYLGLTNLNFKSQQIENEKTLLIDDFYTTSDGDPGAISRERASRIESLRNANFISELKIFELDDIIQSFYGGNDRSVEQKVCRAVEINFYDSVFSNSMWVVEDIRTLLFESGLCGKHDAEEDISERINDLERYYINELKTSIDQQVTRNKPLRKQYIRFEKELFKHYKRNRNYDNMIDEVRFHLLQNDSALQSVITDIVNVNDEFSNSSLFRKLRVLLFKPNKGVFKNPDDWLEFKTHADSILNVIGRRIDSVKRVEPNLNVMATYYSNVIEDLKNQDFENIQSNQCELFGFYALQDSMSYSNNIPAFYENKIKPESAAKPFIKIDSTFFVKLMTLFNDHCYCSPNPNCLEYNESLIKHKIENLIAHIESINLEIGRNSEQIIELLGVDERIARKNTSKALSFSGLFGQEIQIFICKQPEENLLVYYFENDKGKGSYPEISIYDRNKMASWLNFNIE